MLSNKLSDSLASIISELEGIVVSEQISDLDQLNRLNDLLKSLKSKNADLSEEQVKNLLQDISVALEDLESLTSHKINLLSFLDDISPKS
jgi:ABC-type transporter Mla subunit MlaD